MDFRRLRLDDILESEFNPRVRLEADSKEYQQIRASIEQYGFVEPLVVNEYNMHCIGGHQRMQILKDMGETNVDCVMIYEELEEREKALCVALNKISGEWDMDKLAFLLEDDEVSLMPTGFEDVEIEVNKLTESIEPMDIDEGYGDDEEETEVSTVVKIGSYSFTIKSSEYYEMIAKIRDLGIFGDKEIKEELKRRIIND